MGRHLLDPRNPSASPSFAVACNEGTFKFLYPKQTSAHLAYFIPIQYHAHLCSIVILQASVAFNNIEMIKKRVSHVVTDANPPVYRPVLKTGVVSDDAYDSVEQLAKTIYERHPNTWPRMFLLDDNIVV